MNLFRSFLAMALLFTVAAPLRLVAVAILSVGEIVIRVAKWLLTEEQRERYEQMKKEAGL